MVWTLKACHLRTFRLCALDPLDVHTSVRYEVLFQKRPRTNQRTPLHAHLPPPTLRQRHHPRHLDNVRHHRRDPSLGDLLQGCRQVPVPRSGRDSDLVGHLSVVDIVGGVVGFALGFRVCPLATRRVEQELMICFPVKCEM
jgi:hypothetical protein